jgi:hypothetical protein
MTDEKKNRLPESYEEFFALVGYAITQWADVDRLLFELCRFALNVSDRKTAIIFYRSQSIKEHLILTNSLLSESLSSMNRAYPLEAHTH